MLAGFLLKPKGPGPEPARGPGVEVSGCRANVRIIGLTTLVRLSFTRPLGLTMMACNFSRTVAKKGRVRLDAPVWNNEKFSKHYSKMSKLEADLDKLIGLIKPVKQVPFDWYVAWGPLHGSTPVTLLHE